MWSDVHVSMFKCQSPPQQESFNNTNKMLLISGGGPLNVSNSHRQLQRKLEELVFILGHGSKFGSVLLTVILPHRSGSLMTFKKIL